MKKKENKYAFYILDLACEVWKQDGVEYIYVSLVCVLSFFFHLFFFYFQCSSLKCMCHCQEHHVYLMFLSPSLILQTHSTYFLSKWKQEGGRVVMSSMLESQEVENKGVRFIVKEASHRRFTATTLVLSRLLHPTIPLFLSSPFQFWRLLSDSCSSNLFNLKPLHTLHFSSCFFFLHHLFLLLLHFVSIFFLFSISYTLKITFIFYIFLCQFFLYHLLLNFLYNIFFFSILWSSASSNFRL